MMTLPIVLYLLSLFLSLSVGLVIGLGFSWLKMRVIALERAVVTLSKRKADVPVEEKPKTFIADPDDIIQQAKYERDRIRENLNR